MVASDREFYRIFRPIFVILIMVMTFALGLKYSINRHFQPDEFALSKSIHILNFPKQFQDIVYLQFYMVPLSFLTRSLNSSRDILLSLRVLFFVLLLSSLFIASRMSLDHKKFFAKMIVLIFLLTQYPLWRFGIEIRHEVILLFSLVCTNVVFIKFLTNENHQHKYLVATGLFLGLMGQTAYKGLTYSLAISGLVLIGLLLKTKFNLKTSLRFLFPVIGGYAAFTLFSLFILYSSGHLGDFIAVYKSMFGQSLYQRNFYPTEIFKDLITTTPLTLILAGLLFIRKVKAIKVGEIDTIFIFTVAQVIFFTILLIMNPIPFRYNIIIYLASLLLFIIHHLDDEWISKNKFPSLMIVAFNLIICLFSAGRDYYLRYSNTFQLDYIKTAEDLTSLDGRIIDGMGIVATRPAARKEWALYFAQMPKYMNGEFEYFSDAIVSKVPEVAITNYRWQWLRNSDWQILLERYVQIGEHMWLLGSELNKVKGQFEIYKSGRYKIFKKTQSAKVFIANKEVADPILFLEKGTYHYENKGGLATLLWLGPKATNVPYLFIHKAQPFIVPIQ